MNVKITKIDGNKITFESEGNPVQTLELEEWVKPDYVKVGEAEITIKNKRIAFVSMNQSTPAKPGSTASKNHSDGDDMVDFEQLLSKAHSLKAPFSIKTQCLKIDWEKKTAFFKATIEVYATDEQYKKYVIGDLSEESKRPVRMMLAEFEGHGDATEDNCGEMVKKHWIRMAETRAIVRALRWYTNNAKCAEEEKN